METTTDITSNKGPSPLLLKFPELKPILDLLEWGDEIPPDRSGFEILCWRGDTKHFWNSRNPVEVEAARALFSSLTKSVKKGGPGYRAFHMVGTDGARGDQMDEFDPDAERITFVPHTVGG